MIYIGIDPGSNGAIACLHGFVSCASAQTLSSMTERDCLDVLGQWTGAKCFAFIEHQHAGRSKGRKAAFSVGGSYHALRMALVAAEIPFERVEPGTWQRMFKLVFPKKLGLTDTQKKNKHKAAAQELFPGIQVTHKLSDALLLAEYCRRTRKVE